jgi:hypothetical protein
MALFEWHDKKNDSNQKKHGLSFEDASKIFDDPDRIQYLYPLRNGLGISHLPAPPSTSPQSLAAA